jgi:hypothetical protein
MTTTTGGCLCGQVRYEVSGQPAMVAVCHCRNCQRQAGSAFSIIAGYPRDAVKISGTLTTYRDQGEDSGQPVLRQFCGRCGSPILSDVGAMPSLLFIKAGTLDDPSGLEPAIHIFCASKQPWVEIPAGVPQAARNPG